jgi:(4-(4-[2-(gamma-L-glutamylamino)ethyl]phenoxymethyl)furan-2-yl)methanamine synthase
MTGICIVGWDVGGVNTKVSRAVPVPRGEYGIVRTCLRPFEIQRDPLALISILTQLAAEVGVKATDAHALTMTAELSQMFRTKRDGVGFVLDTMTKAFPHASIQVFSTDGQFYDPAAARERPIDVAAANWVATAALVGSLVPNAIVIDVGSTTTDIVPVVDGRVAAVGRTDPARLVSGELLYMGAIRTPVEAVVHAVPLRDGWAAVSAEGFATLGDVHLWRGTLAPDSYVAPTPDGRPATRQFAGERLARVVCADREMLDDHAIQTIADFVADSQVARTATAIARVRERHPSIEVATVAGVGAFIAASAAQRAGLTVRHLADTLGPTAADCAPSAAVALLLARRLMDAR